MRALNRYLRVGLYAGLVWLAPAYDCSAQLVRNRVSVLIDSGDSMLQTPQQIAFSQVCTGWNPCTFNNGNPTPAQETCNACVRDTIAFDASCSTLWDASCRTDYANCLIAVTGQTACSATMTATASVATRGDGSAEIPGCDLNANAVADDSKLFQAKTSVRLTANAVAEVEFALWRFRQVTGGQTCMADPECPDTPGGLSVLTCEAVAGPGLPGSCAFDADLLDGPTTAGREGECSRRTHTGSPSSFACTACDFTTTHDRAACELYELNRVRSSGSSPLDGSTVQCFPAANPTHRFISYHGAITNAGTCDPAGGDRLVDFPPKSAFTNVPAIDAWLDHAQPAVTANELRANGAAPIAAMLRDLRTSLLASLAADVSTPCRRHAAALVVDGPDTCESNAAAMTAASALQNLSFTNPGGTAISGFAVPVHVFALGACSTADPNCTAVQALDAVAAAGGTVAATRVADEAELTVALGLLSATLSSDSCVDALFVNGFE